MKINYYIITGLCIVLLSSCATKKMIKQADKLYEETSFFNAAEKYEKAVEKKKNNSRLTYQLAQTNRQLKDYKQAEKWYKKTLDLNEKAWPEAKFYYAQVLKNQGNYDKSKDEFEEYLELQKDSKKPSDEEKYLKKWAKLEIEGCDLASELMEEKSYSEVTTMEEGVNNPIQDMSPKFIDDKTILMAGFLIDEAVNREEAHEAGDDYYSKLYFAKKSGDTWTRDMLPNNINHANKHISNGVLSNDGNTLYYTMCEENAAQTIECNIYESSRDGEGWTDPSPVSKINKKESTTTQPAIGMDADGNEVMYFVSNRVGTKGGMDIYYAVKDEDGEFSTPKNMGKSVNTTFDEMTPFYDNAGGQLYFSSNGHPGLGGQDVFKLEGNVDSWDELAVNAGHPLNSGADDIYMALNESGSNGYIVSNRVGTTSSRGETCCDDVFKLRLKRDFVIAIVPKIAGTEQEIQGTDIALYKEIEDDFALVGESVYSSKEPVGFVSEPEYSYKINGEKDGFWPSVSTLKMDDLLAFEGDTLEQVIYLKPIIRLKVKNVYFAFDKDGIREMYKEEMDSVHSILMDYPLAIVEISGHTDSKGSDEYNQDLSEKRANQAKQYFMDKGIVEDRIIAQGFGETKPIAPNENPDGSDNPEGRAKNRRVEFKLKNKDNQEFDVEVEYQAGEPKSIE